MGREGAVRPAIAGAKDYEVFEARRTLDRQNSQAGRIYCTPQNGGNSQPFEAPPSKAAWSDFYVENSAALQLGSETASSLSRGASRVRTVMRANISVTLDGLHYLFVGAAAETNLPMITQPEG